MTDSISVLNKNERKSYIVIRVKMKNIEKFFEGRKLMLHNIFFRLAVADAVYENFHPPTS